MSDYNTKRRARNEKCVDSVTDAKKSVKKKVGRKLKFAYFTLTGLSSACFLCACITHEKKTKTSISHIFRLAINLCWLALAGKTEKKNLRRLAYKFELKSYSEARAV